MSIAGMQLLCVRELLNFIFFLYDYISVFSSLVFNEGRRIGIVYLFQYYVTVTSLVVNSIWTLDK